MSMSPNDQNTLHKIITKGLKEKKNLKKKRKEKPMGHFNFNFNFF
jgi:hypothetical protein